MVEHWNTGRCYSAEGQRISAKRVTGGVVFVDHTREIDGFTIMDTASGFGSLRQVVMQSYDAGLYCDAPTPAIREEIQALRSAGWSGE